MESVAHLLETFETAVELLYDPSLEPDAKRPDWSNNRERLDELLTLYEKELLPALDGVKSELDDRIIAALETRAAYVGLGIFAALHASGQSGRALPFLAVVKDRARNTESAELFAALGRDTASAIELARLRHRLANGMTTARLEFKRLAKATREKSIADEALEMFHAPQPLTRAPGLGTLNGFGTGLYGSRDPDSSDGSEIKTLCLSALYIPVFPLSAYRVIDHGDGSYSFMSKNRLSGFARGYRRFLAAAIVLLVGYFAISSYLNSPTRLAGKAMDAADAIRAAGKTDEAIDAYDRVVERWAGSAGESVISRAARSATALRADAVKRPLEPTALEPALAVIRRYRTYPFEAHSADNNQYVAELALGWAADLEGDETAAMNASLKVLDEALEAVGSAKRGAIETRSREIKTRLASALAPRRPIEALSMLVELGAKTEATALVDKLVDKPSLLREAAPVIDRWQAEAGIDSSLRKAVDEARAITDDAERAAALAGEDAAAITASLEKYPGDHELVAALAELDRAAGRSADGIARLTALGEPGWLTGGAQQTLAACYGDENDLPRADAILSELLRFRQPAFRRAASAYYQAGDALREQLIARAERGGGPPAVMAALRSNNDAAAQAAFNEWSAEEMSKDAKLGALKREFEQHVYVVPASITLGTIKLRRANAVGGSERDTLLAEAEAAFLSISDDAVGLPSYHLGLGQVYHRLGKTAEGDAELGGLLTRGDPSLSLSVGRAYRELGQTQRAIEIAKDVYEKSGSPMREAAAHQISYIVEDLDDKELWLERSDKSSPAVKTSLLEVRARRAAEAGDETEAAKLFRQSAKYYEREAAHSSVAANNAAVAYLEIYSVTGDASQLPRARKGLESSLRLEPSNALVVSNLAGHCEFEGWLGILAKFAPVGAMRLERSDIDTIKELMASSKPLREQLVAAARTSSILRRGRELTAQELVLAPSRPSGWERAATWAELTHDDKALTSLLAQVERVKLDTSQREAQMAKFIAGDNDEFSLEQSALAITRYQEMIATARKSKSKRGEAMARYLLGGALSRRGWAFSRLDDLETGLDELASAHDLWPELGDTTSAAALRLAIVRAGAKSAPVAAMRETMWRQHGLTTMLATALAGSDGEAIRSALAGEPVLGVAARALAGGDSEPSLVMWMIGRLLDNKALVERGSAVFAQPFRAANARLDRRLSPTSASAETLVTLIEKRGEL